MTYKRVIAGISEVSVIFEVDNDVFALVGVDERANPHYSLFPDSFLKFGYFRPPEEVSQETIDKAAAHLATIPAPDKEFSEEERAVARRYREMD